MKKAGKNIVNFRGRHFKISYEIKTNNYVIKDLGNGFGTFMKLQTETLLKNNSLVNIGDSYIVVIIGEEESTNIGSSNKKVSNNIKDPANLLNLKIFSGTGKFDPM